MTGILILKNGIYHKIRLLSCDDIYIKILDTKNLLTKFIKISDVKKFEQQGYFEIILNMKIKIKRRKKYGVK